MMISLSEEDLLELRQALELHLGRLQQELVHTEKREYQQSLRQMFDRLDGVRQRLAVLEAPDTTTIA